MRQHKPAIWLTSIICAVCQLMSTAVAEPQKLGPVPIPVKINKVALPLTADVIIDVNSARGNFNAQTDLILSGQAAALASSIIEISKTLLPQETEKKKDDDCKIRVHELKTLEVASQSNQILIKGKLLVSLVDCSYRVWWTTSDLEKREVGLEVAIQPLAIPQQKKLELMLMKTPKVDLPESWWGIRKFGNVETKIEEKIKATFKESPILTVPAPFGARMALQGASVSGDSQTVTLLIRGDAHIDATNATKLVTALVSAESKSFDLTIDLKKPKTN